MFIQKRSYKIINIAKRYRLSYPTNVKFFNGGQSDLVYDKLLKLNPPTEKEIAEITGNDSWVDLKCNECNCQVDELIEIGEPANCESHTADICKNCLKKAIDLFNNIK